MAQADGGAAAGDLSVLCRSCNSRKNAVTRRPSRSRPRGSR
ncbi:MAG: hypothetical protein LKG15_07760 [Corynebacterium provencense]|nr:hypothetical protein [Corynebacterium provencense]